MTCPYGDLDHIFVINQQIAQTQMEINQRLDKLLSHAEPIQKSLPQRLLAARIPFYRCNNNNNNKLKSENHSSNANIPSTVNFVSSSTS